MPLPVFKQPAELEVRPHISFSEAYTHSCCPYKHWQQYREKIPQEDSIYTFYGTTVGEALEQYKKYGKTNCWITMGKKIFRFIVDHGYGEYVSEKDQDWRMWVRSSLRIFKDTMAFLDEKYPGWQLIDFEYPLYEDIEGIDKKFKGYIDLIFEHDGKIYMWDFKTCSWGWPLKTKQDTNKLYQIILYKHFYCQKNNIDPKTISTSYLLLKRKPAKSAATAVELFEQTSGDQKMKNAVEWLKQQADGINRGLKIKNKTKCSFCICGA